MSPSYSESVFTPVNDTQIKINAGSAKYTLHVSYISCIKYEYYKIHKISLNFLTLDFKNMMTTRCLYLNHPNKSSHRQEISELYY